MTVSGLNVAVNVVNADLNAVQNTSFTYGGKLDIQGDVHIRSEILREGDFGKADAQTGSTAGASISLVGASANKATAATATQNTLTVRGVGENRMTLTGSFTARAKSVTESFAKAALPQSLGLASIGSMISDSSMQAFIRGFGNIVSDRDFRFMPYGFARLRPETLAGETLTLKEVWGTRSVTITGQRLEEIQGDVLYIWALEADGITLTHSLRHLHLNRATIQSMTSQGYRWLLFRVGNSLVLIHLEALSDGDYLITLDPENQEIPLSAELNETPLTVPSEEIFSAALTAPLDRP